MSFFSSSVWGSLLIYFLVWTTSLLNNEVWAAPAAHFDPTRVDTFLRTFKSPTGHRQERRRSQVLDARIQQAALSLADTIEAVRRLAPPRAATGSRDELRLERLFLSVAPYDLAAFKFALEYDGDYKDMVEYLFHDIDEKPRQMRILEHFRSAQPAGGIKVLSDVDDTMYANLIDKRYPRDGEQKTLYPGVMAFYEAVKSEPFAVQVTPMTTLSARPNPLAGLLEEASLESLVKLSEGRLAPSALSGALGSAVIGTAETLARTKVSPFTDEIPHGQEDKIGEVKFTNFTQFTRVYPEYRFVFVGDSGQADALTAHLMITSSSPDVSARVITTFIHDLSQSETDTTSASAAFQKLPADLRISKTSRTGRGVIVFRNYIEAAVIAYMQTASLENLITAEELVHITKVALEEFHKINFHGQEVKKNRLREQYQQDAEEAYRQVMSVSRQSTSVTDELMSIRRLLDQGL